MKSKLIVFEGISGTGKETQAKLLKQHLKEKGIVSRIVYHPSPELKPILSYCKKDRHADWKTLTYLLLADRYNTVKEVILPALSKGEWVISLRSSLSALVYQAETKKDRVWIAKQFSEFEPVPDSVFYFDIDPRVALKRVTQRHQKTGEKLGSYETLGLLTKMRKRYLSVIKSTVSVRSPPAGGRRRIELHCHTLNASFPVEILHEEIQTAVKDSVLNVLKARP